MIRSTFVLLKGIGDTTERRLWESGVSDWQAFLAADTLPAISRPRKMLYDEALAAAHRHLEQGDARYFAACLKAKDHWRLYEEFRPRAVYLDIETTGGPHWAGEVTVVGLYGEGRLTSLVRGESLTAERLAAELSRYDLLVTFFGRIFDVPYLLAKFPTLRIDLPHMDLCFAAKRLGLRGGLKQIEPLAGIERPRHLQGLDGWDAVRLWMRWRHGASSALELLLQYNEADVRNLEALADFLYCRLADACRRGPRADSCHYGTR
ncbi:ribonuclease H-like domain-containing protein [Candidatus Nitrospira bockiana]